MASLTGGCMCGAVRYELKSDPFDCGWCHCRTWTKGEPRWIKSSSFGRRAFCGECGTPLQIKVDHQPETIDFPIVTLDDPDPVTPEFHIFWGSKVDWFDPGDDLPRHDKFRPNTRGLEGTEPPDESSLSGGGGGRAA